MSLLLVIGSSVTLKAPEALSPDEKSRVGELVSALQPRGVCINVVVGSQPWDLRPLYLDEGQVWMYRLSQELSDHQQSDCLRTLSALREVLGADQTAGQLTGSRRIWIKRKYLATTLFEDIKVDLHRTPQFAADVFSGLLAKVEQIHAKGQVHGHLWIGNLALEDGRLAILDPVIGTLPRPLSSQLQDIAPEVQRGSLDFGSDVWGLAAVARRVFPSLSEQQESVVDRALKAPLAQRPALSEIRSAFSALQSSSSRHARGKLIGAKPAAPVQPEVSELPENTPLGTRQKKMGLVWAGVALALIVAIRVVSPATFFRFARILPWVAQATDPVLEGDWASNDKSKMREVARLAVLERRPAAENAIVDSISATAQSPYVDYNVLRIAFDPRWDLELRERDKITALALAARQVLPEGLASLPSIETLHPGVVLAVVSQMDFTNPPARLKAVSTTSLAELPSPLGDLFLNLEKLGLKDLANPAVLAACRIATGGVSPAAVDTYFGSVSDLQGVFGKLAAIMPVVGESKELGDAVAVELKEGGGPAGQALGWFDAEDISRWKEVSGSTKLGLLLGVLPRRPLLLEQYSDLLQFPLPAVRFESAKVLVRDFLTEKSASMLAVIVSDQARLTRSQIIFLVSALHLRTDDAESFVSAWFKTDPDPLTVLRLLNARNAFENGDAFNLEAARYLRKKEWQASFEDLKTLSSHPEPLARSLAYARLSVGMPAEAEILSKRGEVESDPALKEVLKQRLSAVTPPQATRVPL